MKIVYTSILYVQVCTYPRF